MDGPGGGPPGGLRTFLRDDDLSPAEQAEVPADPQTVRTAWPREAP